MMKVEIDLIKIIHQNYHLIFILVKFHHKEYLNGDTKKEIINNNSKKKFLAEIGWREFSYNLLFNYPNIRKEPIQEKFKKFPWKIIVNI